MIRHFISLFIMLFFLNFPAWATDTDNDGMPNDWEIYCGLNHMQNDAGGDPDGDGLTNYEEYRLGTHPGSKDSDDDGINDNIEISQYNTDPALADTDNGGISDGDEISRGNSPLNPDDDALRQATISISLNKGWNLISIPVDLTDSDIEDALSSISGKYLIVWAYKNHDWKMYDPYCELCDKTLTELTPGWGYWIVMNEAAVLKLSGTPASKTIALIDGWNMVGYNSLTSQSAGSALSPIAGYYSVAWAYENHNWTMHDAVDPIFNNLEMMRPGYGYWINTISPCDWVIP